MRWSCVACSGRDRDGGFALPGNTVVCVLRVVEWSEGVCMLRGENANFMDIIILRVCDFWFLTSPWFRVSMRNWFAWTSSVGS